MERGSDTGRVVVVGSINVDLVVRVPALPGPGETVVGGTFERHGGGKSANQAVAAARAGAATAFVGAVGADEAGRIAVAELAAEGIDVFHVAVLEDAATGIANIVVGPAGENQIAVASGANGRLGAGHVTAALGPGGLAVTGTDVILVGFEVPDEAVLAAAEAARDAGATLIVNPAPAREIDDRLYRLRPILTPNEGEAARMTGAADATAVHDPAAAGTTLAARTGAAVIVTLGADGALLVVPGGDPVRLPAHPVTPVDTTGAGDAFNGTLAAELAGGMPLVHAARRAIVAAGLATELPGARTGPTRAEVGAALERAAKGV